MKFVHVGAYPSSCALHLTVTCIRMSAVDSLYIVPVFDPVLVVSSAEFFLLYAVVQEYPINAIKRMAPSPYMGYLRKTVCSHCSLTLL